MKTHLHKKNTSAAALPNSPKLGTPDDHPQRAKPRSMPAVCPPEVLRLGRERSTALTCSTARVGLRDARGAEVAAKGLVPEHSKPKLLGMAVEQSACPGRRLWGRGLT